MRRFNREPIVRVGRPIESAEPVGLPADQRVARVRAALDRLPDRLTAEPGDPDPSSVTTDGALQPSDPRDALVAVAELARERPAALQLPAGPARVMLARAARLLHGPRGPAIVAAEPAARSGAVLVREPGATTGTR